MSSLTPPSTSPDIKLEITTQPYEELSADFYDQFLKFDYDVEEKYTNVSPSTYLDKASGGLSISTSPTDSSAYRRASMQHLPHTTPTTQSQMYNDMMEGTTITECDACEQENCACLPHSTSPQAYSTPAKASDSKEMTPLSVTSKLQGAEGSLSTVEQQANFLATFDNASLFGHHIRQSSTHSSQGAYSLDGLRDYGSLTPPLTCKISDISPDSFQKQRPSHTHPSMSSPRSYPLAPYPTPHGTPNMSSTSRHGSRHASLSPRMTATPPDQIMPASFGQLATSPPPMTCRANSSHAELERPLYWNDLTIPNFTQATANLYHPNPQRATKALALQIQNETPWGTNHLTFNYRGINAKAGLMFDLPHRPVSRSLPSDPHPRRYASPRQRIRRPNPTLPHHPGQMRRLQSEHVFNQQQQRSARGARSQQQQIQRRQHSASDTESSASKSPSMGVRKNRSQKAERKASTAKSSSASENGGVEFMNYTPNDSMKILTGVAPSGSSKTKARRKQEALDRRMKFRQAALRAVRVAGGDVDCLMDEGLFV